MKKKILVVLFSLLLAAPAFGFAKIKKVPAPSISAFDHANKNARFKRTGNVFNNKAYKKIRTQKLAEEEAMKAKDKVKEAQGKGEGPFKVKF